MEFLVIFKQMGAHLLSFYIWHLNQHAIEILHFLNEKSINGVKISILMIMNENQYLLNPVIFNNTCSRINVNECLIYEEIFVMNRNFKIKLNINKLDTLFFDSKHLRVLIMSKLRIYGRYQSSEIPCLIIETNIYQQHIFSPGICPDRSCLPKHTRTATMPKTDNRKLSEKLKVNLFAA